MAEYKCGDCFHAELCEKSEMLVGFSRDNPAYCGMFLNSADIVKVRHGRWIDSLARITPYCSACGHSHRCLIRTPNYCPNCGAKMEE